MTVYYNMYSLLVLPGVGIEPETTTWFHSEVLFEQTLYQLCHMSCQTIQIEFFGDIIVKRSFSWFEKDIWFKCPFQTMRYSSILLWTILFYQNSYRFFSHWNFLINGSQILFISAHQITVAQDICSFFNTSYSPVFFPIYYFDFIPQKLIVSLLKANDLFWLMVPKSYSYLLTRSL